MLSLHCGSSHRCAIPLNTAIRLAAHVHFARDCRFSRKISCPFGHSVHPALRKSFRGGILCKLVDGARHDDEHEVFLKKRAGEIVDELRGTCIYLVGMMGSGKSTIGKILAEALGYYFFDSDKLIEEAAGGTTVSQLFEEEDEDSFRDAETEVLKQLSCMGRLVVATGGGMVLRPMNWSYLRHGVTVWLDVPVEILAKRVIAVGIDSRPLLGMTTTDSAHSQALERLSSIFNIRGPYYADADATVSLQKMASQLGYSDVNTLTPAMVALEILEEINKLIKRKK